MISIALNQKCSPALYIKEYKHFNIDSHKSTYIYKTHHVYIKRTICIDNNNNIHTSINSHKISNYHHTHPALIAISVWQNPLIYLCSNSLPSCSFVNHNVAMNTQWLWPSFLTFTATVIPDIDWQLLSRPLQRNYPDSKIHGANMGPIWGRQELGGPHVGPMNFAIWVYTSFSSSAKITLDYAQLFIGSTASQTHFQHIGNMTRIILEVCFSVIRYAVRALLCYIEIWCLAILPYLL